MERIIKRGDIFYATLNPVIGSEQGGTRPVLTISNNTGNRHSPTIIVVPITSRTHTKAKLPTHTEVKDFDKLDKDSIILLEQIRTIDKQRLKQYIGLMPDHIMARVDKALGISLVAVGTSRREVDILGLTFGQKSITGSGGYTQQDVKDVMEIMKSGKWDIEKLITDEYKLDDLSRAIERASDVEHALNVVIGFD